MAVRVGGEVRRGQKEKPGEAAAEGGEGVGTALWGTLTLTGCDCGTGPFTIPT